MKRRTIFSIVLGVIVLHVGMFMLFGQMRALPKARYIAPPNFGYQLEYYDDPKTGERTLWREIRVSTKLSETLKNDTSKKPEVPERKNGI
jgi:hypothetical protein